MWDDKPGLGIIAFILIMLLIVFYPTNALAVTYVQTPRFQHSNGISEPERLPYCPVCKPTRDLALIRAANYGTIIGYDIPLRTHISPQPVSEEDLRATTMAVMYRLKNLEPDQALIELIFETALVGSRLGQSDFGITEGELYLGITQIRAEYATGTLFWLVFNRLDIYNAIMKFIPATRDPYYGTTYSIPTNIAIALQYYWLACPDLTRNVQTREQRAVVWAYTFAPRNMTLAEATEYYLSEIKYYEAHRALEPPHERFRPYKHRNTDAAKATKTNK